MIAAIWKKHWMELWRRWAFLTAFGLLPGIAAVAILATGRQASHHPDVASFLDLFTFLVLAFFPSRFGGTGLTTSMGARPCGGADPALLFTLSLPIRRRGLFFYRSVSGLLAMETAAAAAWAIDCLLLVHLGASWHALVPAIWVLPALVPFYFLDSLLLIRFSEMTTMQVQGVTLMILWLAAPLWFGVHFEKMVEIALQRVTSLPVALAMCLLSAVFAATTVWRLDRQSY
jgi:hypothetical protein